MGDQVLKFLPSALFVTGEMALANLSPEDPFPPSSKSPLSHSTSSSSSSQSSNPLLQVFLEGYLSKKAMEMVVERTPVFLVREDELGLRGADLLGCQILTTTSSQSSSTLSEEEIVKHDTDQMQGSKEEKGGEWTWYAMLTLPLSLSLLLLLVMRRK